MQRSRAKDWWGTQVWTRTTEVLTPLGFRLRAGYHPAYRLMQNGTFEREETEILSKLIPTADRFVDVGANLGYYTCLACSLGKEVIAFEPQSRNVGCLMENLAANGWSERVRINPVALTEHPGILTLYGASGPSASLVRSWAGYSPRYHRLVPTSTLDLSLLQTSDSETLIIKIDVEGAEFQVLKGALATLDRKSRPTWLIEICHHEYHPEGKNPDFESIFSLFFARGYKVYTATVPLRPVLPQDVRRWHTEGRTDHETFNYLFVGDTPLPESIETA